MYAGCCHCALLFDVFLTLFYGKTRACIYHHPSSSDQLQDSTKRNCIVDDLVGSTICEYYQHILCRHSFGGCFAWTRASNPLGRPSSHFVAADVCILRHFACDILRILHRIRGHLNNMTAEARQALGEGFFRCYIQDRDRNIADECRKDWNVIKWLNWLKWFIFVDTRRIGPFSSILHLSPSKGLPLWGGRKTQHFLSDWRTQIREHTGWTVSLWIQGLNPEWMPLWMPCVYR